MNRHINQEKNSIDPSVGFIDVDESLSRRHNSHDVMAQNAANHFHFNVWTHQRL